MGLLDAGLQGLHQVDDVGRLRRRRGLLHFLASLLGLEELGALLLERVVPFIGFPVDAERVDDLLCHAQFPVVGLALAREGVDFFVRVADFVGPVQRVQGDDAGLCFERDEYSWLRRTNVAMPEAAFV
ncbi:hypothetical protein OHA27_38425 [Streptomyces sp. NBC_01619]|uniref:hypothetical protein n=1 Tax=Streptomyces sp. NBC_01619 TaxID=2975901 RepID=UPI00224EDECF|nr:hypothetical protein [Streptomyces sp. NBC_01619]MCX4515984.1 hypothetical protein [Streptomyces sp. NBC_01619]